LGALPKPKVPAGAVSALFDELHRLHHLAGWPSLRAMAKEIGCSHTTVSAAFSGPRVPRWGLLELIVETLGGDTEKFHRLWLAGSRISVSPDPDASDPSPAVGYGAEQVLPKTSNPPPRQLPLDVAAFTGRADELAALHRLLDEPSRAVVIAAMSGTAGVGKTALAVHWAHRVADRFPDGQLYVDLRGYDPGNPVQAPEALEALLRELGVDGVIPHELPERAARYRTLLAERKMLILLDNAHSMDQIRDLLPGTSSCFVVVTSRQTLPALVARYGAVRVNLDLLPANEAVALLRTLIGARVDAEPEQASALAEHCARLPLALRIAAELAASRPKATLAHLVAELGDEHSTLDLLAAGDDDYTGVRSVFSWSHRHLSIDAAHAFRLIGLHPARDIDDYAAAALVDVNVGRSSRLLRELARAHLVEELGPGRYGMHDLLRAYAAEQAAELTPSERRAALDRVYDYFLYAAAVAMDIAFPHNRHHRPRVTEPDTPVPHLTDPAAARTWLTAECHNLIACAHAASSRPGYTADIAATIAGYLDERSRYDEGLALHELARTAAVAEGDRAAEGSALNHLAIINRRLGVYPNAIENHRRALDALREVGERTGEGRALHGLGILLWRLGRYQEAHEHLERAVAIYREVGDRVGEGGALYSLGTVCRRLGRYADAEAYHRMSIAVLHEVGDLVGEGRALNNLGVVRMFLGRYDEALDDYGRALEIHREIDDRVGQGAVLDNLGTTYRRLGRYEDALAHHQAALAIYLDIGYPVGEGDALRGLGATLGLLGRHSEAIGHLERAVAVGRTIGESDVETGALIDLGEVQLAAGRTDAAVASYRSALALAEKSGDRYEKARALAGIAGLLRAAGDMPAARKHWQEALNLYASLGLPDAETIRGHLGSLDEAATSALYH
jgi:tetratricopeptide (TPR) repeat protein